MPLCARCFQTNCMLHMKMAQTWYRVITDRRKLISEQLKPNKPRLLSAKEKTKQQKSPLTALLRDHITDANESSN